jgi:hypothetical protein
VRSLAASIVLSLLALPGCCGVARVVCAIEAPPSPPKGTRDTPAAAVDFLIEAFRERRISDIYRSLHPDFRSDCGGFSQAEFAAAYDRFEEDFDADARSLAASTRSPAGGDPGGPVGVALRNEADGAEVTIWFVNEPRVRVVTKDDWVGTLEGAIDKAALVRLEGGRLGLPADLELATVCDVGPDALDRLRGGDVVRVEIHDDWLVRHVPTETARNIRFLDKIKEHLGR